MTEQITVNRLTALLINDVIDAILNERYEEDGEVKTRERNIPFRLRYRLTRNQAPIKKDVEKYNSVKLYYTALYGKMNEDETDVIIPEENKEKYSNEINKFLSEEVTYSILRTDKEDLDAIEDFIPEINNNSLILFEAYMSDDMELFESIAR